MKRTLRNTGRKLLALSLALLLFAGQGDLAAAAGADENPGGGGGYSDGTPLPFQESDSDVDARMDYRGGEEQQEQSRYAETDSVRVSIVLEKKSALDAGYSLIGIARNKEAEAYQKILEEEQKKITAAIETQVLGGDKLDVVWNMTLAANLISANVPYGKIEEIEKISGVSKVIIETPSKPLVYSRGSADPRMATSSDMIGTGAVWSAGYTGAGSRIAVIDTGIDTDHQSFDGEAFEYSLQQQAETKGDGWLNSLNLLEQSELSTLLPKLHIYKTVSANNWGASRLYQSKKIPFAFNYADGSLEVTHDTDSSGEHGSHVAGIAAANSYIKDGSSYANALTTVHTQGVAPDAQLLVMKLWGRNGGGFESDYMVAIEDAYYLGADVVNLSLGTSFAGFSRSVFYEDLLERMCESDMVIVTAAGNAGSWADQEANGSGMLYGDDVNLDTVGTPASLTNSFAVASVDNRGVTDYYLSVGNSVIHYTDNASSYGMKNFLSIAGSRDYVLIDGVGSAADFSALDGAVSGKIAVCARGSVNFAEKANAAHAAGAAGLIVYNNEDGNFAMNMTGVEEGNDIPNVSVSKDAGDILRMAGTKKTSSSGAVYYEGTLTVSSEVSSEENVLENDTMSSFSSWGVPGSLELKPEITAPGGNIYSVNGAVEGGKSYENMSGTSMASPQIAGMTALMAQFAKETGLADKLGRTPRQLATSLLMSSAEPVAISGTEGIYYPVIQQGAGLANVDSAIRSGTFLWMDEDASAGAKDGKIKAELGDDPSRIGSYHFGFTVTNLLDETQIFVLNGSFFTQDMDIGQDGARRLSKTTHPLSVNTKFELTGDDFIYHPFECDADQDGDTDRDDAQYIVEYAVGNESKINPVADLDEDGSYTTEDAHLLLAYLGTVKVEIRPASVIHVDAYIDLTEAAKQSLNANYENGAYFEGYVFLTPDSTKEGGVLPQHSIPVLGYYGNWSDPSMFDRITFTEALYGEDSSSYMGVNDINNLDSYSNYVSLRRVRDPEDAIWTVNPYLKESTRPLSEAAINSRTLVYKLACSLIRDASSVFFFMQDSDGSVVDAELLGEQVPGGFYYEDETGGGHWENSIATLELLVTPAGMGFEEGDSFTLGFLAVPEYYERDGFLTESQAVSLMESGTLGAGVTMSQTFYVDDTPPVAQTISKKDADQLIVTAKDNRAVAAVALLNSGGSEVIQTVEAEEIEDGVWGAKLDLSGYDGGSCKVLVGDYAGNEKLYDVAVGDVASIDYSRKMYGFALEGPKYYGAANSWACFDKENLKYDTLTGELAGEDTVARSPLAISAAEYVAGYVYMAGQDGYMYVAQQGAWENLIRLAPYREDAAEAPEDAAGGEKTGLIRDMAYHYKDHTLYALGENNVLYSVDLSTGQLKKEFEVKIKLPDKATEATEDNKILVTLAIDDEGNFYSVNSGYVEKGFMSISEPELIFLYKWTKEQISGGELSPVSEENPGNDVLKLYSTHKGYSGGNVFQSMAWDHDDDLLFWASSGIGMADDKIAVFRHLAKGDVKAETLDSDPEDSMSGMTESQIAGLYIVPSDDRESIPAAQAATGLTINPEELTLLKGATVSVSAELSPWNLADKSVEWSTQDGSVAAVENGVITAAGVGSTTITAASKATSSVTAQCTVTVIDIPEIKFGAQIYDGSKAQWADFNTKDLKNPTVVHDGNAGYIAGALLDDTIYVHDGSRIYGVDADSFRITPYTEIDMTWNWTDAAPAPFGDDGISDGYYHTTDSSFGRLVGLIDGIDGGTSIAVMNVEKGTGDDMATRQYFYYDRAAAIAYYGKGTYEDSYEDYGETETLSCPSRLYYVLTESGELWQAVIYETFDKNYDGSLTDDIVHGCELTDLGPTGLDLGGVSSIYGGQRASMLYDEGSGYLLVSVYLGGKTNKLYAVDPKLLTAVEVGDFGSGNCPVIALYQYDRITDLTVKVKPDTMELYVGESAALHANIYPVSEEGAVNWSIEPGGESVVKLENGNVTALAEGVATVTATKTGKDGAAASDSCVITVKKLAELPDAKVKAYVEKKDGSGRWVEIDLGNHLQMTDLGKENDNRGYSGAAAYNGKIYANAGNWFYQIDPSNDYSVEMGAYAPADGLMLDGTAAVGDELTLSYVPQDSWEPVKAKMTVPGSAVYVTDGEFVAFLEDFKNSDTLHGTAYSGYEPAALTWYGNRISPMSDWEFDNSESTDSYVQEWLMLGSDGYLWKVFRRTYIDNVTGESVPTAVGIEEEEIADLGHEFADRTKLTMTRLKAEDESYDGLLIADAGDEGVTLYWCNISNLDDPESLTLAKAGVLKDVADIAGLFTDAELEGSFVDSYQMGYDVGSKAAYNGSLTEEQQAIYDAAYNEICSEEGYQEQYQEGYNSGYMDGYSDGYKDGRTAEYSEEPEGDDVGESPSAEEGSSKEEIGMFAETERAAANGDFDSGYEAGVTEGIQDAARGMAEEVMSAAWDEGYWAAWDLGYEKGYEDGLSGEPENPTPPAEDGMTEAEDPAASQSSQIKETGPSEDPDKGEQPSEEKPGAGNGSTLEPGQGPEETLPGGTDAAQQPSQETPQDPSDGEMTEDPSASGGQMPEETQDPSKGQMPEDPSASDGQMTEDPSEGQMTDDSSEGQMPEEKDPAAPQPPQTEETEPSEDPGMGEQPSEEKPGPGTGSALEPGQPSEPGGEIRDGERLPEEPVEGAGDGETSLGAAAETASFGKSDSKGIKPLSVPVNHAVIYGTDIAASGASVSGSVSFGDASAGNGEAKVSIKGRLTTNGLLDVRYDPAALTFHSADGNDLPDGVWAFRADENSGTVRIGYATAAAASGNVADVKFTYQTSTERATDFTLLAEELGPKRYDGEEMDKVTLSLPVWNSPDGTGPEKPDDNSAGTGGEENEELAQAPQPKKEGKLTSAQKQEENEKPSFAPQPEESGNQETPAPQPEDDGKQGLQQGDGGTGEATPADGELHCSYLLLIIGMTVLCLSILFSVIDRKRYTGGRNGRQ